MCRYTLSLSMYIYIYTWRGNSVYRKVVEHRIPQFFVSHDVWQATKNLEVPRSSCHMQLFGVWMAWMSWMIPLWMSWMLRFSGCFKYQTIHEKIGFSKTCPDPGGGCEAGSGQVAGAHWFKGTVLESYVFLKKNWSELCETNPWQHTKKWSKG